MRVAVLTNSYPPDARGGSGRVAELQAEWLKNNGHEVRVFVPAPFSDSAKPDTVVFKPQTSIAFADLAKFKALRRLIFHFEDLAPNSEAVESIRKFKPDVLLTHNLTGCGWGTPKLLKQAGIRHVHVLHDVQMVEPSGQIFFKENFIILRSLWRRFWSSRRSKALGSPDAVVSPSTWLLNFHLDYHLFPESQTCVIPNPIQTAYNVTLDEDKQNTADHKSEAVLYVGRVSKDKGAEVLINAWGLLKKKNKPLMESEPQKQAHDHASASGLHLVIVGDGPYLKTIQALNDPSIQCLGAVDHAKISNHYQNSSLFVFPSLLKENQPTVLLEAMSHGLNIVASDIGGVAELLQGYGSLTPPGDAENLASTIAEQLNQKPDLSKAQEILQRHQIDVVMQKLTRTFSE